METAVAESIDCRSHGLPLVKSLPLQESSGFANRLPIKGWPFFNVYWPPAGVGRLQQCKLPTFCRARFWLSLSIDAFVDPVDRIPKVGRQFLSKPTWSTVARPLLGLVDPRLLPPPGLRSERSTTSALKSLAGPPVVFRKQSDDVFARLLTFPNVVITGHQAFLTNEALQPTAQTTAENIREFATTGTCRNQIRT